ncbi:hypothetical protein BDQ17DRAFT_445129 [Cyathus striatus]|nr:hypothetical protein BDQ17DRAFT_445129 [Cyathus striatus]
MLYNALSTNINNCQSCCSACNSHPYSPSPSSSVSSLEPFALHNLLPVGTITIRIFSDGLHTLCDHQHAEDGWHRFSGTALFGRLTNEDDIAVCHDLEFLQKQNYIVQPAVLWVRRKPERREKWGFEFILYRLT